VNPVAAATEVVVSPLFVEAPVIVDSASKILYVKRPENEPSYSLLCWRESHMALVQAQETGFRNGHETVWAGVTGDSRITYALAVPGLKLQFQFPGVPSALKPFQKLTSTPGLVARVQMDRSANRFVSVRFTNVQS
jgi:hypothetical protein